MTAKHPVRILILFLLSNAVSAGDSATQASALAQPAKVEVVFDTTMGSFTVELSPEQAPKTVENFLRYVDTGFYDDTLFHRVIPNFMVQAGGFNKGPERRLPYYPPVENESMNGLKNVRGSISMARTRDPDSATSQFFVNVVHNFSLDAADGDPGYTVFGRVIDGMRVLDEIVAVPTAAVGRMHDTPQEDIVILAAQRKLPSGASADARQPKEPFQPNVHYVVLNEPIPTRNSGTVEVVQAFAYGCPHCFAFDSLAAEWRDQQGENVEFWRFPAVWNEPMEFFARIFFSAEELGVVEQIHLPLYNALLVEQQKLGTEDALASWFAEYGVESTAFLKAFNSTAVERRVQRAEARTRAYNLGNVPQVIVNGKYAIDITRTGGRPQMLAVVDYLVNKERALSAN